MHTRLSRPLPLARADTDDGYDLDTEQLTVPIPRQNSLCAATTRYIRSALLCVAMCHSRVSNLSTNDFDMYRFADCQNCSANSLLENVLPCTKWLKTYGWSNCLVVCLVMHAQ